MEELVLRLAGECRMQQAVAMSTLESGVQLFAYPLSEQRILLALGVGPDAALTAGELLSRRAARLRETGGWLPSMFNDGSLYLVRRLSAQEEEGGDALASQLRLALEILN
ncbi:MAG: hypothetical protein E2576_02535 [Alcaligenaceae bacterium]|nr:hypothetical protein [Alcaligenaceae bacterium SAGV5]MPS55060.1 hypothetical protein [Alcaligenaceae bacterium SAGV3]MPT55577.1 hypothetical protein [Alcaligenaceae bacterium]